MILISHRGNIDGVLGERENTLSYIDEAINAGYHVEIDMRIKEGCPFLGHDAPEYKVALEWLLTRKSKLWIHAKDTEALVYCKENDLNYFFHEKEKQTLISNGLVWTHDLEHATKYSMVPLISVKLSREQMSKFMNCYGLCSDYVGHYKRILG